MKFKAIPPVRSPKLIDTACSKSFVPDVVVMTQACDLEYEKVENVILCPHVSLDDHRVVWEDNMRRAGQNPTEKDWDRHCNSICDGFMWNLAMLNDCRINGSNIGVCIVDFSEFFYCSTLLS